MLWKTNNAWKTVSSVKWRTDTKKKLKNMNSKGEKQGITEETWKSEFEPMKNRNSEKHVILENRKLNDMESRGIY
jgi:hypothetical protein